MNNQQEEEYMNSLHPSRSVLELIYYIMTVICVIGIVSIIFQLL
ncbi:hypothetical protein SAMN04487907_104162 [Zunongwangia mangrovi]|uniref:Uncharacterized protein n=1 Tax=Zunongwangia mangrovi TaxID=1334022 RepID=A0A1I1JB09_9FLAO|nr:MULTISPECIES: hypothetical protein [Zunongwangia]SFC43123.1 hypothetical protein SAMN04487907_104162 [Zunongwangia mangrovi]